MHSLRLLEMTHKLHRTCSHMFVLVFRLHHNFSINITYLNNLICWHISGKFTLIKKPIWFARIFSKLLYLLVSKQSISGFVCIWLTKNQWHESVDVRSKDSDLLYIMFNVLCWLYMDLNDQIRNAEQKPKFIIEHNE